MIYNDKFKLYLQRSLDCTSYQSLRLAFYQTYTQTYGTFHISTSWAWRVPSTFQGLVPVIQVCLIFFVPESPRWLVSKGRYAIWFCACVFYYIRSVGSCFVQGSSGPKDTGLLSLEWERVSLVLFILRPNHDVNLFCGRQDPLVEFEFREIKAAIDFERSSKMRWISLFTTPGNRKRMRIIIALAVFSQWSGNGLV
jgi:hypothetical protein